MSAVTPLFDEQMLSHIGFCGSYSTVPVTRIGVNSSVFGREMPVFPLSPAFWAKCPAFFICCSRGHSKHI